VAVNFSIIKHNEFKNYMRKVKSGRGKEISRNIGDEQLEFQHVDKTGMT